YHLKFQVQVFGYGLIDVALLVVLDIKSCYMIFALSSSIRTVPTSEATNATPPEFFIRLICSFCISETTLPLDRFNSIATNRRLIHASKSGTPTLGLLDPPCIFIHQPP